MGIIVTVFGSAKPAEGEEEYREAYEVGYVLGKAGFVVCNGGYGGTMEASARGAKEAGGKTIGVTAEIFARHANPWIDQEIRMKSLVERLMKLIELGSAYIVLRGGTGTLLELAAVWEFITKRLIAEKPIITIGTFWDDVVRTVKKQLLREGLEDAATSIVRAASPSECLRLLQSRLGQ